MKPVLATLTAGLLLCLNAHSRQSPDDEEATIAALTGTPLPADRTIDCVDISPLLTGDVKSPRDEFLYYALSGRLEGIRRGDWKLVF